MCVSEIFNFWIQAGRVDVGFPDAAQIDRFAAVNTTVIGPYDAPLVRLPEYAGSRAGAAAVTAGSAGAGR